jgi:succinate dehydrogenase/fumarate reductase flavoprotein subunit
MSRVASSVANVDEFDIVVFGSGAAGLTAAVVAACEGLRVGLFEKAAQLGGTTATSGGAVWIPCSAQARAAGIVDSIDAARRYLEAQLGRFARRDLVDAYLGSGPEALDYLARRTEIVFDLFAAPDYVSTDPGASDHGRCLAPRPFDGALLGPAFAMVRPPRPAFMVLGGLMVGRKEIPMLLRPFASAASFRHVARLLIRHLRDRLKHPRGARLLIGNALIARALYSARRLGVHIETGTALVDLVCDHGRVTGARVRTPAGVRTLRAARGVVLATGGFPHDADLRRDLASGCPHRHSLASEENAGDAIRAARKVGGAVDTALASPAFWTPASVAPDGAGGEVVYPYGHLDRGKPGAIIVNRAGRRFVNESDSYHHIVLAMFERRVLAPGDAAFLVCDHAFIARYGLGLVKPAPFPHGSHLRSGYLKRADTLAALARKLGVDPDGLVAEVRRHNAFCEAGRDQDFHKGETAFNRYNGDDRGQPNACLLPIARAPFYAIEIVPCTLGTAIGLRTDDDARVTDAGGRPIEGLYAVGNDMASVVRGTYPGPGITIGPGIVFAWRAMRHAAGVRTPVEHHAAAEATSG